MRFFLLAFFFPFIAISAKTQPREFRSTSSALIYSDSEIASLSRMVDSLHLREKFRPTNKIFFAYPQTHVQYVRFMSRTKDLKNIIPLLETKTGYRQVVKRFSKYITEADSSLFMVYTGNKDKKGGSYNFAAGDPLSGYNSIYLGDSIKDWRELPGTWVYQYQPRTDDFWEHYMLDCWFFPSPWEIPAILPKYGQLIQYVDCLVDTSFSLFLTDMIWSGGWLWAKDEADTFNHFGPIVNYIQEKMGTDSSTSPGSLSWENVSFASEHLKGDSRFELLLTTCIDDYINNKQSGYQLAALAEAFEIYDKALLLKRLRRMQAGSSMDNSARTYMKNIALLSIKNRQWDVFIRSHLNLMNDFIDRTSDLSIFAQYRLPFLKELEAIGLNTVDLLFGMSLRAENTAKNHYEGAVWRLGWALSESKNKELFEERILAMLKDKSLDEFNSGLLFLLYSMYMSYLEDAPAKQKLAYLRVHITDFPIHIQSAIRKLDIKKMKSSR